MFQFGSESANVPAQACQNIQYETAQRSAVVARRGATPAGMTARLRATVAGFWPWLPPDGCTGEVVDRERHRGAAMAEAGR